MTKKRATKGPRERLPTAPGSRPHEACRDVPQITLYEGHPSLEGKDPLAGLREQCPDLHADTDPDTFTRQTRGRSPVDLAEVEAAFRRGLVIGMAYGVAGAYAISNSEIAGEWALYLADKPHLKGQDDED